jgi:hypothetical protein
MEASMTTRTSTKTVTFARPFLLDEVGADLPAGDYQVETEEETLDGVSFLAYRRVATHIMVRTGSGVQVWAIHPDGLDFALARDRAVSAPILSTSTR